MYSRAAYFRRRGLDAQQRAAQTTNENIRFQEVAAGWFELADLGDRLERRDDEQKTDKNQSYSAAIRRRKHAVHHEQLARVIERLERSSCLAEFPAPAAEIAPKRDTDHILTFGY